ncbi:MAG: metallophosphoesterase [Coriobacteriales bacterium]|jgi:serine/threonine protein phosphatase 1|nr:metallophosphoesterase [Coriobacteriales bacterium]
MATYVFSDVHGHIAPVARLLSRVSPSDDDTIFMLGDMIDRGPDPLGVMYLCRDLPGCTVLLGNHEDLMLSFFEHPNDDMAKINWVINGGGTTAEGLASIPPSKCVELLDWVGSLPLSAHTRVNGRPYLMVHAGIRPIGLSGFGDCTDEELDMLVATQSQEDLIWIREEFWEEPTGLLDKEGRGPIIIAGHTPTPYLEHMHVTLDRNVYDENGKARMIKLGACEKTGGVADRWNIDCCAAGGYGRGQVLLLRLDDGEEFYEPVLENE